MQKQINIGKSNVNMHKKSRRLLQDYKKDVKYLRPHKINMGAFRPKRASRAKYYKIANYLLYYMAVTGY